MCATFMNVCLLGWKSGEGRRLPGKCSSIPISRRGPMIGSELKQRLTLVAGMLWLTLLLSLGVPQAAEPTPPFDDAPAAIQRAKRISGIPARERTELEMQ